MKEPPAGARLAEEVGRRLRGVRMVSFVVCMDEEGRVVSASPPEAVTAANRDALVFAITRRPRRAPRCGDEQ